MRKYEVTKVFWKLLSVDSNKQSTKQKREVVTITLGIALVVFIAILAIGSAFLINHLLSWNTGVDETTIKADQSIIESLQAIHQLHLTMQDHENMQDLRLLVDPFKEHIFHQIKGQIKFLGWDTIKSKFKLNFFSFYNKFFYKFPKAVQFEFE